MVEITDGESAKAWLGTQDQQTQVWFASRCALRALPGLGKWQDATRSGLAFATCWAMLLSAAAATCSPAEMTQLEGAVTAYGSSVHSATAQLATDSAGPAADALSAAHYAADSAAAYPSSGHPAANSASAVAFSTAARSTAWTAATADANAPKTWGTLWPDNLPPDDLEAAWEDLKVQWKAHAADWSFWINWYEAVRDGRWTNWDLIFRIATDVSEEDWEAGPARVAARIAEIRKEFEPEPLDQDALQTHVQKLAQHPVLNADIARSAGQQIESIIQAFKTEAPANQLPDGFEAFEKMPPTFFAISAAFKLTITEAPDRAALQAEINRLHGVIAQLRSELNEAKLQLLDVRLTAAEAQQIRTFGEKAATTLTSIVSLGVIAGGMAWFFGVPEDELRYDALKERLNGLVEEMEKAQPSPDADTLPRATEV